MPDETCSKYLMTIWTRTGRDVKIEPRALAYAEAEVAKSGIALTQAQRDLMVRAVALINSPGFGMDFAKKAFDVVKRGGSPDFSKMPEEIKSRRLRMPNGRVIMGDGRVVSPGPSADAGDVLRDPFENLSDPRQQPGKLFAFDGQAVAQAHTQDASAAMA